MSGSSSSQPHVTFIVANRNYGRFLDQCIRSILDQPYRHKQLIVVDDHSDDDSWQVTEQHKSRLLRLRQVAGKRGQAMAWNLAFQHVQSDWVWFVDSDDFLVPDILPQVAAHLDPAYALFYGDIIRVDEKGIRLAKRYQACSSFYNGPLWPHLIKEGCIHVPPTSGLLFKTASLHPWMPIPHDCFLGGADDYLRRQVGFEGPVKKIHKKICCYRVHSESHTLQKWTRHHLRQNYIVEKCGYHIVKMRARNLGIAHPAERAQIDMPHAILAILMSKLRDHPLGEPLSNLRISFARETRLQPWKRLFYLLLGFFIAMTPPSASLRAVQLTWHHRFQRCLKPGRAKQRSARRHHHKTGP